MNPVALRWGQLACLWLLAGALPACRQVVDAVNAKQLAPLVVERGCAAENWYEYLPAYAPYFCLRTRHAFIYHDAEMQLGYWRALHPLPPHRVLLEARGSSLIIHRSFVWDGMSFGRTEPAELVPSLLHDALYYARQGDAPFSRREADLVFLRACRRYGCSGKYTAYVGVRSLGGFFGKPEGALAPRVVLSTPEEPPAALEPGN
jgi:hypothetical protein